MPIAASSVPIFSTVWFTEIPAKQQIPKNIEWNDWELLDSSDLSDPKSSILNVINLASIHFNEKRNLQALSLSNDFYAELVNVLRPKFDVSLSSFDNQKYFFSNFGNISSLPLLGWFSNVNLLSRKYAQLHSPVIVKIINFTYYQVVPHK